MPRESIFFPDLGTLSVLPLEIREAIYAEILNFNAPVDLDPEHPTQRIIPPPPPPSHRGNRTSLLRTSKRISRESKKVLINVNEWCIFVEPDQYNLMGGNYSINGRPGWFRSFGHPHLYNGSGFTAMLNPASVTALFAGGLAKELRFVDVRVGVTQGVEEADLVPWTAQQVFGPERPSFCPVVDVMKSVVLMLEESTQLHYLRVMIRSAEQRPGNIGLLLEDVQRLRGVRKADVMSSSILMDETSSAHRRWVDWTLNRNYSRYLQKIMALPKDAPTPAFVPDKELPPHAVETTGIFDIVDGDWVDRRMPDDDSVEEDMYEVHSGTENGSLGLNDTDDELEGLVEDPIEDLD